MKKGLIGIGIAFLDIVIQSDYSEKNHSFYSKIHHQVGGSILNIVSYCSGGLIYKKGNDSFSEIVANYLKENKIDDYGIFTDKPMPIFTIINQKERYTSLTDDFEMNENVYFDYSICDEYEYGITNSTSSVFINQLLNHTKCKWIINSYLPEGVNFNKLEGCILSRDEAKKYSNDYESLLYKLKNTDLKWAIITLDKEGCIYLEDNQIKYLKPTNQTLHSKIRTGDIFTSTLIKQLINRKNLTESIKIAMKEVEIFLEKKM